MRIYAQNPICIYGWPLVQVMYQYSVESEPFNEILLFSAFISGITKDLAKMTALDRASFLCILHL